MSVIVLVRYLVETCAFLYLAGSRLKHRHDTVLRR